MAVTPPGQTVSMASQLRLLDPVEDQWRIDEQTRQIGLAGVRAAREALRSVRPTPVVEHPDAASPAA
jgi:hypothetical protein